MLTPCIVAIVYRISFIPSGAAVCATPSHVQKLCLSYVSMTYKCDFSITCFDSIALALILAAAESLLPQRSSLPPVGCDL